MEMNLRHLTLSTRLHARMREALRQSDHDELVHALGYRGPAREIAHERLQKLQASPDLYDWMQQGGFDFRYPGQVPFLRALVGCLPGVSMEELDMALEELTRESMRLACLYPAKIVADTGVVKCRSMNMALAGRMRYIHLNKREIQDDFARELARVQGLVRAHYEEHDGRIPLWGHIQKYDWYPGPDQVLSLGVDGTPLIYDNPESKGRG